MDMTLEQPARGLLITADEQERPVPARLCYHSADPLAVHFVFPAEVCLDGSEATWTFGRTLLEEGLRGPAGAGDVHLWPCGPRHTAVELHAPCGMALLRFDTEALRRFLLRTYAVVPAGREDIGAAVEQGLEALFGGV
jgi:hypothetical protein